MYVRAIGLPFTGRSRHLALNHQSVSDLWPLRALFFLPT